MLIQALVVQCSYVLEFCLFNVLPAFDTRGVNYVRYSTVLYNVNLSVLLKT